MAARKAALTVVAPDAKAPAKRARPKTLAQAIESDDYLEILLAQRRELVRDVRSMSGAPKAAAHRQIALLSKEIAGLQAEKQQEADEDADVDDEPFDAEAL